VLRALDSDGAPATTRAPLLELARIEADGRRSVGAASGLAVLALAPGEGGWLRVLVGEMRNDAARADLLLEGAPFAARRERLDGRPIEDLRIEDRRVELRLEPGRCAIVALKLRP
jgi:hypothetical protein